MKKRLLILFVAVIALFTACGSSSAENKIKDKKTRKVEDLLEAYAEASKKADLDLFKKIFPPFATEVQNMSEETFKNATKNYEETYGKDFKIKFEITDKTKMSDERLDYVNENLESRYGEIAKASECYEIKGSVNFKGSKSEKSQPINGLAYCKFDGSWYLIG